MRNSFEILVFLYNRSYERERRFYLISAYTADLQRIEAEDIHREFVQASLLERAHVGARRRLQPVVERYNGFFGCRPFSTANDFLKYTGQQPIDWSVSDK